MNSPLRIVRNDESATLTFRPAAGEPAWLAELREAAWRVYSEAELPDRVVHLWRYTEPEIFLPRTDAFADAPPAPRVEISDKARKAGVVVMDLQKALAERAEAREFFGKAVPASHGKFEALNLAAWRGGLYIHIPRGVTLEEPLRIQTELNGDYSPVRVLVVAEENSEATVVDEYTASVNHDPSLLQANVVMEIFAGDSSRLRYATAQRFDRPVQMYVASRMHAGRDASVLSAGATLGAQTVKMDQGVKLLGRGAKCEIAGVVFAEKREHADYHTVLEHIGERTTSNIDVRTALRGKARAVYTGLIRIEETALHSDAYQVNRNLLLSPGTRAETIPELEIMTDEVRCSHGATVSPVDPQQIFYLMSRGLSRPEATRVIVEGFFETALRRFPEAVQESLRGPIAARLEDV